MADTITDYEITEAMLTFGGGFVQQLGKLYWLADEKNQARIKSAWPEIWVNYAEFAALKQAQRI